MLIMEKLKLKETMTKTEEEIADFLLEQGSSIHPAAWRKRPILPRPPLSVCVSVWGLAALKILRHSI